MPFAEDLELIQVQEQDMEHFLDAQILAQVYLAMTGGQSNLFQETQDNEPQS